MKDAVKHTTKKMAEEIIMYGIGKAEEEIMTQILNSIKNKVKKGIVDNINSNMEKEPLATLVDFIILSHLEDKKQLHDLLEDKNRKNELLAIFKKLSNTAVKPFYADLSWQNKFNSSFSTVINSAKAEAKAEGKRTAQTIGTKVVILTQDSHGRLAKMQELSPDTKPASQTVTLIYRPKSTQYPDSHYDVRINNQTVSIVSEDKSCLFHALARGMRPKA
ncbi:unnamed protein product, partial [Merluccius merluccius]